MGPSHAKSTFPSRSRFTWDAKSPSWTDGKGKWENHKIAVDDWKDFHVTPPTTSPNKIISQL